MYKIWEITSYEDYKNNWPSLAGKFERLTSYQKSLGYQSAEDFFKVQAYAAQNLANDRVGGILDRVFNTTELNVNSKQQLIKFTYQAIDFIRMNDLVINQEVRLNQSSGNNNRLDSTTLSISRIEEFCGAMAWRSWRLANIEVLYESYCENKGIPFLLDPTSFYSKSEIDLLLVDLDNKIQYLRETLPNDQTFINATSVNVTKAVIREIKINEELQKLLAGPQGENGKDGEGINSTIVVPTGPNIEIKENLQEQLDTLKETKADIDKLESLKIEVNLKAATEYVDSALAKKQEIIFETTNAKDSKFIGPGDLILDSKRLTLMGSKISPYQDGDTTSKKYVDDEIKKLEKIASAKQDKGNYVTEETKIEVKGE